MKQILSIFLLSLFSLNVFCFDEPKWINSGTYIESAAAARAFKAAQEYYLATAKNAADIDYSYFISVVEHGYVVSIDIRYRQDNGEHAYAFDTAECVYIDKSFKIKGKKQCYMPGPNPLTE